MTIYKLWDMTDREHKKLIAYSIDKRDIDKALDEIRDKLLDPVRLIVLEQRISHDVEEYID